MTCQLFFAKFLILFLIHLVEVDDNDNESDVETIDVAADEEPEDEEPGGSSENNGEVSNHLVGNSPSVEKDITIVVIDD